MTTLITGGAGFVGLNIAEKLLASDQQVVIYDLGDIKPKAHLDLGEHAGRLITHAGNVLSRDELKHAIKTHGVDRIVHAAAITASVTREKNHANDIVQVNTIGTINVLEAAIETGVKRVVSLGTGSVYGSAVKQTGTLDEIRDLPQPETLYGISKYAAERIALRYHHTRDLDVVVARLGVVFGRYEHDTGLRDTMSAPLILGQLALQGAHAKVYAQMPDDWVYATDVAQAVMLLLDSGNTPAPLYQIGTGHAWSVADWCKKLSAAFAEFSYELVDDQTQATVGQVTPSRRPCFSIDRLRQDLGYEPSYMLDKAFEDYVRWLRTTAQG